MDSPSHWLTQPIAIHGEGPVGSVECLRMELGPPHDSGRRFPAPVPGSNFRLPADMVITSLGQSRLIALLEQARGVKLRNQCVAITRETGQMANPKYFAGGDWCQRRPRGSRRRRGRQARRPRNRELAR